MERLNYIDEHRISVDASVAETWSALLRVLCDDPAVYRLVFELDPKSDSDGVELRALIWAAFPGLRGMLFRMLAIEAGAHRFVVRRLLRRVAAVAYSHRVAVR
jgi:hypothetical protein